MSSTNTCGDADNFLQCLTGKLDLKPATQWNVGMRGRRVGGRGGLVLSSETRGLVREVFVTVEIMGEKSSERLASFLKSFSPSW